MKRTQRVFGDIDALRYVDDRLDEDRRAAFTAHLAEDAEAAERVRLWSRQNEALRAAFSNIAAEPVPVWLRLNHLMIEQEGLAGLLEQAASVPRDTGKLARLAPVAPAGRRKQRVRTIAAAVALVAAGAFSVVAARTFLLSPHPFEDEANRPAPDRDGALLARAIDAYRTFALDPAHPVEIASTQQQQLEHWLQRRLSIPVHAPDLRQEGWTLLGGRLAPGDLGPAGFFVYENDTNDRMGLYVAMTTAMPRSTPLLSDMAGGSALSWVSGPVGYVLTVGKDQTWMARNAETLKAKIQATPGE